jgi:hypothetical protein
MSSSETITLYTTMGRQKEVRLRKKERKMQKPMLVTLLCYVSEELPSKETVHLYRYQKSCDFVPDMHVLLAV